MITKKNKEKIKEHKRSRHFQEKDEKIMFLFIGEAKYANTPLHYLEISFENVLVVQNKKSGLNTRVNTIPTPTTKTEMEWVNYLYKIFNMQDVKN